MANNFYTFQTSVTTSGTPVQLDTQNVEPDQVVVIKAKTGNTGSIVIGNSSANALNSATENFRLLPGQFIAIRIPNTAQVWIDATVSGEGVEAIVGADGMGVAGTYGNVNSAVKVTPDAGTNFYYLFGNASGIPTVNTNLNSGSNLSGASMTYVEMVARGLAPGTARKILKATGTLSSGALTLNSWTDQSGTAYTAVTTNKTLYIETLAIVIAAKDATNANSALCIFGDATNKPLGGYVTSGAPLIIPVKGLYSLGSAAVPTATFSAGKSDDPVFVEIIGWEE